MSQENVEIVRRASEAALRHPPDWETVSALYDPNHDFISPMTEFEGGPFKGASGFREWRERMSATGEWGVEIVDVRDAPDGGIVVISRTRVRGAQSGVSIDQPTGAIVTVRNGKIVRTELFNRVSEALEAAGLQE